MDSKPFFIYFLVGCLVALALHIYFFSTISPQILEVPSPFLVNSLIPPNTRLQEVTKLGEGHLKNPEDICVDKNGILYTATRDGWIRRLQKNGSVFENWKWINSSTMLGMTTIAAGGLVICDAEKVSVDTKFCLIISPKVDDWMLRYCGRSNRKNLLT
ncbi:Protein STRICTOSIDINE SYNTHASE-LIKE 4 [Bienertia sinuspersici]